jgi:Transposase
LLEDASLAACLIRAVGRERTMKRSKFSEAQIAFILRQAEEGTAVGEVCRKAGISEATY